MKEIIKTSFIQLLIAYTILVFISSLSIFSKFTLHFEILAIILAIFAVMSIENEKEIKINKYWIFFAFILIFLFRIIPYLHNSVPLGYDPGMYHYVIQNSSASDKWVTQGFEPGLFMLTNILKSIGMNANSLLTYGLIFFELLLGMTTYFVTKKFFNKSTGIIAVLLYAVSVTQFMAFEYNYYKQIVGMILLLWSFYLMKEKPSKLNYISLIATASFLGAVHRPTFLIFGLVFIANMFYNSITKKKLDIKNIILGFIIIIITLLFYAGRIKEILLPWLIPIATANIGSGTFIDIVHYSLYCLAYLPFALFGFFFLARKKKLNLIWFYFLINGLIVVLKLIFFNRYIISFDIAMIILAAYGIYLLLQKKAGTIIVIILLISSGYIVYVDSINAKPLITEQELNIIKSLNTTEPNSFIMSTSGYYSPWLLYSQRRVIAPGMFDYDNWTEPEWNQFWNATNVSELMNRYQKPTYVFVGEKQYINNNIFITTCFKLTKNISGTRIYKWDC